MKAKLFDILTCVLFCGFLATMLVVFLLTPHQEFSELEKKALADAPPLEWDTVRTGDYGEAAEEYIAEQLPGRTFFVGINAYYDLLSGRQGTKEILVTGDGHLVEKPNVMDEGGISGRMTVIDRFSRTIGQPVDLMIVPSAGYVLREDVQGIHNDYTDDQIISHIYSRAGELVRPVQLLDAFCGAEQPGELYYKTDHHWTAEGAYLAYTAYMDVLGRSYPAREDFMVERYAGFYGTTYSRSGLWLTEPDAVELWHTGQPMTVTIENSGLVSEHSGLFFREQLQQADMYPVYLNGNQPLVRVHNPRGEGKLLVIRDSYANCLGTLLANTYEEVVLVDLRYFKLMPVSELVAQEGFDQVLVCYSLYNFLTDSNLPWLK